MRERYLVILNDTIPFVSELLEDENERVELAAKSIVNRIEQLTGESINEYLKYWANSVYCNSYGICLAN